MKHLTTLALLALAGSPFSQAQTCNTAIPLNKPDSVYIDHGNGTVTDSQTGLMWQKCAEGQTFVSGTCTGTASLVTWKNALGAAQTANDVYQFGYDNWRVPNKNELASLIEYSCVSPAINNMVFLGTPSSYFWSASPNASYSTSVWVVSFDVGYVNSRDKGTSYFVRFVRDSQ